MTLTDKFVRELVKVGKSLAPAAVEVDCANDMNEMVSRFCLNWFSVCFHPLEQFKWTL